MIEKITKWLPLATFVVVVAVALMLVGNNKSASLGAAGDINTQIVWFVKGLTAGNPKVSVIDSSGNIVAPISQTTSDTATSTAKLGCVQTTATSTATPIRMLFTASTTATAISGTQAGFVLWGYGTCPF